ncbi:hypothetical protein HN873_068126 [Arachis hypogaea]
MAYSTKKGLLLYNVYRTLTYAFSPLNSAPLEVTHFPRPRPPLPVAGATRSPFPTTATGTSGVVSRCVIRRRNGGDSSDQRVRSEDAEREHVDDNHYYVWL